MAEIVLGMGASHGTMLTTPSDIWDQRIPADRGAMLPFRGRMWSYDDLVDHRRGEDLGRQVGPEIWRSRHADCMAALDRMADVFERARIDVAVIVGNDQMEVFDTSVVPALSVFWGAEIVGTPHTEEQLTRMPPGIAIAMPGYTPPGGATYAGEPALGRGIIETASRGGFDVAAMQAMPRSMTPHAFGFVYRRIMRDRPPPSVPILLNTFYPPNQPSAERCAAFGGVIADAVRAWDSPARVALIASGGLSHFVIDEDLDTAFLDAIRMKRIDRATDIGEAMFQGGSSELKNWIPVARVMADLGFEPEVVDYVPCYRTEAGTGNAMGFVCWTNPEAG